MKAEVRNVVLVTGTSSKVLHVARASQEEAGEVKHATLCGTVAQGLRPATPTTQRSRTICWYCQDEIKNQSKSEVADDVGA